MVFSCTRSLEARDTLMMSSDDSRESRWNRTRRTTRLGHSYIQCLWIPAFAGKTVGGAGVVVPAQAGIQEIATWLASRTSRYFGFRQKPARPWVLQNSKEAQPISDGWASPVRLLNILRLCSCRATPSTPQPSPRSNPRPWPRCVPGVPGRKPARRSLGSRL